MEMIEIRDRDFLTSYAWSVSQLYTFSPRNPSACPFLSLTKPNASPAGTNPASIQPEHSTILNQVAHQPYVLRLLLPPVVRTGWAPK
jgi:hypothetical protein